MIRRATIEDTPELAGLLAELGFPAEPGTIAGRLRSMDEAGELVLVAEIDGRVLGLSTVHITPVLHRPTPVGRITALVVAPGARGRGIGRSLVEAAERHLAGAGCGLVEVTSNRSLGAAHAFYGRLGYEITSFRFRKELPGTA
ncbi:MAG: GNAT family N-acetyltransferase [Isosphaeraceae bacterium]